MAEAADAEAEVALEEVEVEGTPCVLLSRYMNGNPCTSNPVTPATTATTQLRLRAILLMAMAMLMLMLLGQWMVLLLPLLFTKPPAHLECCA